MKRIILTTILADICGCISAGLISLYSEENSGIFLLVVIYMFGNIFIPTLIGVLLYQVIKKKLPIGNSTNRFILHITILILILVIGVLLWTMLDVINNFTIENLIEDFNRDFRGFIPFALVIAVAIPSIDILLTRKSLVKHNY